MNLLMSKLNVQLDVFFFFKSYLNLVIHSTWEEAIFPVFIGFNMILELIIQFHSFITIFITKIFFFSIYSYNLIIIHLPNVQMEDLKNVRCLHFTQILFDARYTCMWQMVVRKNNFHKNRSVECRIDKSEPWFLPLNQCSAIHNI